MTLKGGEEKMKEMNIASTIVAASVGLTFIGGFIGGAL